MTAITIRRATTADAAAMAAQMNHPEVFSGLLQMPHTSEEVWKQRLQDLAAPGKTDILLVAERDGAVVGSAGLHPVSGSLRRRHTMMLGISVIAAAQGQGVGSALMAAVVEYVDNWANILRLELTVFADNARAIKLYEKFGFEHEGRHRAYGLRNGQYVDALAMARLHPNPPRWN